MSVIQLIIRCDHPGCEMNADVLAGPSINKWLRNTVDAFPKVLVCLDYCPDHAAEHKMQT